MRVDKYPPPDDRWVRIGKNAYILPRDKMTKEEKLNLTVKVKKFKTKKIIKSIMDDIIEKSVSCSLHEKLHTGSSIAKSGFKAEDIFKDDTLLREKLEIYFKKKIQKIDKFHRKKYDTIITFNDNTELRIQNKKIEDINSRGDSFDRRDIKNTFDNQFIRKYLVHLCLFRPSSRKTNMDRETKKYFIKLCNSNINDIKDFIKKTLIGNEDDRNDYFCIMHTNKIFDNIELYCISSHKLLEYIYKTLKIDISLKDNGTCLHLSPNLYLQRKGGGKTDHSPNDIQSKIKIDDKILNLCDKL